MIINEPVNRIMVGSERVAFIAANGKPLYINQDGLVPYLPALKANPDGTGEVALNGTVQWVEDLTGNGNTAVAATTGVAPLYDAGGGLHFDGTDDYFVVQHSPSLDFGGKTQITLETWAKSDVVGWAGIWNLISRYSQFILGPTGGEIANIVVTEDPGTGWVPVGYGGLDWGQESDPAYDSQVWHHYCGVVDTVAGYSKLYVDGLLKANFAIPTFPLDSDTGPIHLGNRESSASGSYNFSGRMSDVRIWDVVRTQTEIQRDMNRRLLGQEVGLKAYWPF